jgi:signal transduction histidine kinase
MLGIALPTNFVTEANTLNRNVLSLIFSVGLVMILTVGFTISRQIIQPISQLVRVTRAITRGDLNRRSGITGEDEVAVLAANFDVMTAELQEKNIVLEKQAGELRAILSSIADGVIVQDLSGNILAKNPAAERILQKIGESISQDTEFERTRDPFDVFLETLGDLTFGQKRKLEIGQLVLSAVVTPVITSEGIQIGLAIVLDDITREVESERLKDKFINTTSHELKTPLTAVKGYSNVLKMLFQKSSRQLDERIYERIMDNVRRTEKQIGDLNNVVQSMLDLSEIEAEIFHVIREPIDLVEIVQTVVRQWEPKMVEKDLAFNILLPEEPIWIEGDYERLTQTFHHLIKNAYAYTLIGQVEVVVTPYDDQVQITIRDTGVGVLKEDQPYLFTRFFRAVHEESTYEVAGVGLGLYLSKAIIELHGGQIWMESKIYQGSTVQVVLPIIATPGNNV